MALLERQASFMPTIKCSDCGLGVGLSALANHVCSNSPIVGRVSPEVLPYTGTERPFEPPIRDPTLLKPRRPMQLPKIDPYAHNRPAPYSGELTPASSGHGSLVVSPKSATSSSHKLPWPMPPPPRKLSTPVVRGPPSPELISQDCAFPPFPTLQKTRSNTPSESSDTDPLRKPAYVKSNLSSPIGSVRTTTPKTRSRRSSASSSKSRSRSRTLGAKDEPASAPPTASALKRRPSLSNFFGLRKPSNEAVPPLPTPSPSVPVSRKGSAENAPVQPITRNPSQPKIHPVVEPFKAFNFHSHESPKSTVLEVSEPVQEPPTRLGAYERQTLDRVSEVPPFAEVSQPNLKLSGSPLPAPRRLTLGRLDGPGEGPMKEPSYLSKRPPPLVSDWPLESQEVANPSLVRPPNFPYPITDPLTGNGLNGIMGRRPSDSASTPRSVETPAIGPKSSSTNQSQHLAGLTSPFPPPLSPTKISVYPPNSIARLRSLRPELPVSPAIEMETRPKTPTTMTNPIQDAFDERATRSSRISVDSASSYGSETSVLPSTSSHSSPPRDDVRRDTTNFNRGQETQNAYSTDLPQPLRSHLPRMQTDSPTDPLFQNGFLSAIPPSPTSDTPTPPSDFLSRQTSSAGGNPPKDFSSRPVPTRSKTLGTDKGICRGCKRIITANQKSVFSGDGRLTGRFHKECFVCQTCRNPFATADFYVFKDQPYCSHHYHEANGTLCTGCGNGIEGQYLETLANATRVSKKFHPNCLACTTCHCPLRDDYFEFNCRVYCERDALRMASPPVRSQYDSAPSRPSPLAQGMIMGEYDQSTKGRFPERRTTKLMMMI